MNLLTRTHVTISEPEAVACIVALEAFAREPSMRPASAARYRKIATDIRNRMSK